MPLGKGFPGNDNIAALHLMSMAARARDIASRCGSEQVAEILEIHARLCDRNLATTSGKRRGRGSKPVAVV
jgi:hypothetical protein